MKAEKIEEEMQRWHLCRIDYNIEGKLNTEDIQRYANDYISVKGFVFKNCRVH
jgi:hypothetical protein